MNANTMSCWSLFLVLVSLVAGQQHQANAFKTINCVVNLSRLPERVYPSNYKLYFWLHTGAAQFFGDVQIDLVIQEMEQSATLIEDSNIDYRKTIILNAENLVVTKAAFHQYGSELLVDYICHDADKKILAVILDKEPYLGPGKLMLDFKGIVKDKEAKGLFISSIKPRKWTLATHLEPAYARMVFPCFDEPQFKASFDLTIEHPLRTKALSNCMKISDTGRTHDGRKITIFKRTPKMSSYLLSLAVGEFEQIMRISQSRIPIAIYVPIGLTKLVEEMLRAAEQVYDTVTYFFMGLQQPLEKIDIVALNNAPITMENWGLITMSWDLLTAGDVETKPNTLIRAIAVLMNQMIHQRLASLFTMHSREELWLQEVLAAHLAIQLTAELYPKMGSELYTLVDTTFSAMNYEDDPGKVHRIKNAPLKTVDNFESWYDLIAYKKSVAVFRMVARFVGKDNFKSVIQELIQLKAERGLVTANDWWDRLSSKVSQYGDMREITHNWTEQYGYPTIFVELRGERTLIVSQIPEFANGQLWLVPIKFQIYGGPEDSESPGKRRILTGKFVLSGLRNAFDLPPWFNIEDEKQWVKFNANYHGYYRVVYASQPLLSALSRAMKSRRMPLADRMQLMSDSFSYVKRTNSLAEFISILLLFLELEETDDGVVLLMTVMLTELHNKGSSLAYSQLVYILLMRYYAKNGYMSGEVGSDVLNQRTRGEVVNYLINKLNIQSVIDDSLNLIKSCVRLPPFLRQVTDFSPQID